MSDTNTTPSLEELVYYMEDSAADDISKPPTPNLGIDPTEEPIEDSKETEETPEVEETIPENTPTPPDPEPPTAEISTDSTEKNSADDGDSEENEETPSIYDQFYSVLTSEGVLSAPEDFEYDGTPEKLQEVLDHTKQELAFSVAKNLWEKLPEDFRSILDYGLAGGTDLDALLATRQQLSLDDVDLENVSQQREIMRRYFKETTKYDESRIERMIDKLDTAGGLQEDAAEALDDLQELATQREKELIQKTEEAKAQQAQQAQELRQHMATVVDNSGYINTQRKGKVKAFLFNPITKNQQVNTDFNRALQSVYANPEHLVQLADLLLDYDPKKGLNLERFQKVSKSAAAKSLKAKLDTLEDVKSKVSGQGSKVSKSSFDWEEFLKQN